ncbi:hypothetical protein BVG79_01011 [Ketogulonicigenium robustum]|uniref:Uncharacterized protein n=1 Tax=Ketogulonicigenium robustum TaxID=92947 RepID=A0A1W6NZA1_9RHOB|nr:hypothetical protein [Ketogulonicigenium robustum]ARO14357.1 hypothetical protein BVG79_01011 [Ketogulonicigenium robustum]
MAQQIKTVFMQSPRAFVADALGVVSIIVILVGSLYLPNMF